MHLTIQRQNKQGFNATRAHGERLIVGLHAPSRSAIFALPMNISKLNDSNRLDARARLLSVLLVVVGVMVLPWGAPLWAILAVAVILLLILRPPFGRMKRALAALLWMLSITVLVHAFTAPGKVLWEMPLTGWILTLEGLATGLLFAGRLAVVVVLGVGLSLNMGPLEGVRALEALASPLRWIGVPVATLTMVLALALRFVPTIFEEALLLRKALMARGWSVEGGITHRIRSWVPLFVPVLASGLRRSDDVAETLVLRGYDPTVRRSSMIPWSWGWGETVLVAGSLLPWLLLGMVR